MDKRQKRTNNYLKKGLTQLLSTQNYSDITIQQLAEASHINRSTFYLHYQSKDDFIVSIIDETITVIRLCKTRFILRRCHFQFRI